MERVTLTREQFVKLVAEALIDVVESSPSPTRLHPSEARYKASYAFDRAVMMEQQQ